MTTPQQITLERAKKLSEIASTITTLEVQEVEAKSQWAWIAVQLGQQFRDAKEAWKGAKGEVQSWRVWVEGDEGKKIRGHSNHSLRTVQEYMLMADVFEAATETQRAALLAGGSIRGFNEVRKELGNETGEEIGRAHV